MGTLDEGDLIPPLLLWQSLSVFVFFSLLLIMCYY